MQWVITIKYMFLSLAECNRVRSRIEFNLTQQWNSKSIFVHLTVHMKLLSVTDFWIYPVSSRIFYSKTHFAFDGLSRRTCWDRDVVIFMMSVYERLEMVVSDFNRGPFCGSFRLSLTHTSISVVFSH